MVQGNKDTTNKYIILIVAIVAIIAIVSLVYASRSTRFVGDDNVGQAASFRTGVASNLVKTCPTQDPVTDHSGATYDNFCESKSNGVVTCYYKRSGEMIPHSHDVSDVTCKTTSTN